MRRFRNGNRPILLFVACLLLVSLSGCGTAPEKKATPPPAAPPPTATAAGPKPGGTLRWALSRDVVGIEPHVTTDRITDLVYENLIDFGKDGELVGILAESWEVQNPTTYVFKLRKGVKFHKGNDFTSADVKYSLERILDPKTGCRRRAQLELIDNIETPDSNTVKITLKKPYAVLLSILTMSDVQIVDKKWMEAGGNLKKETNGTGPYTLVSAEPDVGYLLKKNPNYWQKGRPYIDEIKMTIIRDDKARVNSMYAGESDFTEYVPWTEFSQVKSNANLTLHLGWEMPGFLRMNVKKKPFDDVRVRQAMNYLIDRKEVIDLAWGALGEPISATPVQKGEWWFVDQLQGFYKYDKQKADELLKAAGIKDPSSIEITIRCLTMPVHWDTAQVVMNQLRKYGFKVKMEPQEQAALTERRVTGDYQMMMDGQSIPYRDPDWLSLYFASRGTNYAKGVGFANKKIDDLFDKGIAEPDQAKRKAIYADLQKEILNEAPMVYLNWRPQAEITGKNLKGYVRVPVLGLNSYKYNADKWWIDTGK
jgi:ABC-type transport system substrate-binding protein